MVFMTILTTIFMVTVAAAVPAVDAPASWQLYIGTYTGGESEGIYKLQLDTATGKLENLGLAVKVENPSFLAVHPDKPLLYSVGPGIDASGTRCGLASALAINSENGNLTLLNQEVTVGDGPCHVTVDRAGQHILAANYGSGSAVVLPINEAGGLGAATSFVQHEGSSINPKRQEGPHAHCVKLDAAGKFAFVIDLGTDKIMVYRYNDTLGKLETNDPDFTSITPGSGPRHFAFHPLGKFAYVLNELGNTVTAFQYDAAAGSLKEIQTIGTLPKDFDGENTTAEICVHPSGDFVYASNRGHNSIACFSVDSKTGRLTSIEQVATRGEIPRNFNISPGGRFLVAANQESNNVVSFRINSETGILEHTGFEVEVPTPVCVLFYPVGEIQR